MNDMELMIEMKRAEVAGILAMDTVMVSYASEKSAAMQNEINRIRALWTERKNELEAWIADHETPA